MLSLEYIAGFIDGEGSFHASHLKTGVCSPSFSIGNTDSQIIYMLADSIREYIGYSGDGLSVQVSDWHKEHKQGLRTHYRLSMNGKVLGEFIRLILPFLVIRHDQAEVCLWLSNMLGENHYTRKLPPKEKELCMGLANYLKELNSVGGARYSVRQPA